MLKGFTLNKSCQCIKAAKPFQKKLAIANVILIPVSTSRSSQNQVKSMEKRGFDSSDSAQQNQSKKRSWIVEASNPRAWSNFLESLRESNPNLQYSSKGAYVLVQLDGAIKAKGSGVPPWEELAQQPGRDDIRSKIGG